MKRGSIALARSLCYEIAGPTDEDDDITGSDYGSVDIAEILSAEVERLRAAICATLDANGHLADGEVCTLLALKVALRESGAPWAGDELHNALNEPHEFVEDCDCRDCAIKQRDIAIWMLAEWCVAVDQNGTGWDDWDEYYKDAAYRPGPLRERLNKAIAEVKEQNA
jgi:hypothetical protein